MKANLELTEEIACFDDLLTNLKTRKKRLDNRPDATIQTERQAYAERLFNLKKQIKIIERHLLTLFQQREEQS